MRLYDTITQYDLNKTIDLLLNNYHREIMLNIDENTNDYCNLTFDLSDGVDAGNEIIFNNGDSLHIRVADKRLALMGYTLRLYFYQLDKGDYSQSKDYGDLQSIEIKVEDEVIDIPFEDNQVYLQKTFDLILLKDSGYRLLLSSDKSTISENEEFTLTADYTFGTVPVEDITVSFYNGETLIGTGVTDSNGLATLSVDGLTEGTYNFSSVADGEYSNNVSISVLNTTKVILTVSGSSFSEYNNNTSLIGNNITVDYGDGTVEPLGTRLSHSYTDGLSTHKIKIYGVTSFGKSCFQDCNNLISIIMPESISSFGDFCFRGCNSITSMKIPTSVTKLGHACFNMCGSLISLNIPTSVTSIGEYCFNACPNLTSIILNWTNQNNIVTYTSGLAGGASSNFKFSIPQGTKSLYTAKKYPSQVLQER